MRTQGEEGHLPAEETGLRGHQPCRRPDLGLPASRSTGRETLLFKWRGLWQAEQGRAGRGAQCGAVARPSAGIFRGCSCFRSACTSTLLSIAVCRSPSHLLLGHVTYQPCPAYTTRSGRWGSNPSFVSSNEVPLESCRPGEQPWTISCSTNADIPTGWPQVRHP